MNANVTGSENTLTALFTRRRLARDKSRENELLGGLTELAITKTNDSVFKLVLSLTALGAFQVYLVERFQAHNGNETVMVDVYYSVLLSAPGKFFIPPTAWTQSYPEGLTVREVFDIYLRQ